MENITKEHCKEFEINPAKNPLTGRKIQIGKITYKKLRKACASKQSSSKSPRTHKFTKENKYIPPLGPMMHWNYKAEDITHKRKNAFEFIRFIKDRYSLLQNVDTLSKSEIDDYIEMLTVFQQLRFENKIANYCARLQNDFEKLNKTVTIINDQPKHEVYANVEIKPSRTFNRGQVAFIYNLYSHLKSDIEQQLLKKTNFAIAESHVKAQANHKRYLNYMIKKKLFTYDDIYKKTFQNDKFPQEIEALYKQYRDKYYSKTKTAQSKKKTSKDDDE